jgi:hypothetical protein
VRCASIGIVLLVLSLLAFANVSSALAQAGSTGGSIGKRDKSISGGEQETERPRARLARNGRPPSIPMTRVAMASILVAYGAAILALNTGLHKVEIPSSGSSCREHRLKPGMAP